MEWQTKKLEEVCTVVTDGVHKTPSYTKEGVRFISIRNIGSLEDMKWNEYVRFVSKEDHKEFSKKAKVEKGDILFPRIGTLGFAKKVDFDEPVSIFVGLGLAKPDKNIIDPDFLEFWMNSPFVYKFSHNKAIGTGRLTLALRDSRKMPVPVPPLLEQKRIVKKLDEVFEKIEKARKSAEKNLENTRELLDSYLNNIFANPGKDWEEKKLKEICEELFAGGDVPKKNSSKVKTDEYDIPIYANGIKDKGLYGYTNIRRVVKPSVTISARGTIGYSEIRNEPFFPVVRLIVLVPNPKIVDVFYLYYITRSFNFSNTGTSIPQLTIPMVENLKIALPPLKEQKIIVEKLEKLSAGTKKLEKIYEQKLADLEELKKSIMNKAFTGEI